MASITIGKILDTALLAPLRLLFELVFGFVYQTLGEAGWAIILLSIVMNLILLPFYRQSDKIQQATADKERSLQKGVRHIRKTFSGEERMMMLQTYYRQNDYKQTDALRGSIALLLEIPFFIAAYQFLSGLTLLEGAGFGPISDLAVSDGLLQIGSWQLNALPLLMTLFNIFSTIIYTRQSGLRTKIQLYVMAGFFLIFLYNSPAALLLYWTLNNLFSLIKNLLTDNPWSEKLKVRLSERRKSRTDELKTISRESLTLSRRLFLAAGLFLTVLCGLLIPSAYITSSPLEFVDIYHFEHPGLFVLTTFLFAVGVFLVWLPIFYRLSAAKIKPLLSVAALIFSGLALFNYMFFGRDLGVISPALQYEEEMIFLPREQLVNWLIILLLAALLVLLLALFGKKLVSILLVGSLALTAMSVSNLNSINKAVREFDLTASNGISSSLQSQPHFYLSNKAKNVVVLMFDRAMGTMLPYIFNEKPELEQQFAGFTYYPNTISYGGHTNFAAPPLLGGYEYTPVEMNKRWSEALVDKHNEALKVMPVIFSDNGYKVTVCDPPYANYRWFSDLSIYDDYPAIDSYITRGKFSQQESQTDLGRNHRNFFLFSLMKTLPLSLQPLLYDQGNYRYLPDQEGELPSSSQTIQSLSKASGFRKAFIQSYDVLQNFPAMTKISDEEQNTFLFLSNDSTHEPMLLQTPDYLPAIQVDNRDYDAAFSSRFQNKENGRQLKMETTNQMAHYHINMAMMLRLGQWFDDLREQGVYDNTRIIIVSDHGSDLRQIEELILDDPYGRKLGLEFYYPLLLVKDFNADQFSVSEEFMTNADVPTLAFEGLISKPVNPFTGKEINNDEKFSHEQFITLSHVYQTDINDGNTFLPSAWASVKDNIWQASNWTFYPEEQVLSEYP
ncbi:MAG: sulfatase-like hydrolase/transferase [Clostridiaceae bacterium]|jgi:YidC/Oxa1 family membrane protein insertase|nr:sulfatase-like hydrolase/transferase [Clostridiaceae bacterium]